MFDEISPVTRHDFSEIVIVICKSVFVGVGIQRIHNIHDFRLMKCALILTGGRVVPVVCVEGGFGCLYPFGSESPRGDEGIICGGFAPCS